MSVLENSTSSVDGTDEDDLFVDLFTDDQLKSGAIILYIIGKKRKYVHLPLDCRAWQIQNSSFLGIIYMIIAFYLLCKEYLVPSLFAIADKGSCSKSFNNLLIIQILFIDWLISGQDVTGGFVMATGISMPGLITGIIGVFFSKPEVGIGKMVGSINFNILVLVGKQRICTFDFEKHIQLFNSASFMQDMRD